MLSGLGDNDSAALAEVLPAPDAQSDSRESVADRCA